MAKKQNNSKKKTTAAAEKEAREAREAKKAPARSKAAKEALATAAALAGTNGSQPNAPNERLNANDPRDAEIMRAREIGIELATDEFLTEPQNLPEGYAVKKVVSRNGKKLPQPIFRVIEPKATQEAPASITKPRKAKADVTAPRAGWETMSVEGDRAKAVLQKLQKGTRTKPVMAAKQLNDNERHLARRLFAHGLIRRDKFEEGIGYYA